MDEHSCSHLLDSLSDYIDGSLGFELCAELEQHMEGCENCRIVIDSLRKTIYLYQETCDPPSVPDDIQQRLYKCLNIEEYAKTG